MKLKCQTPILNFDEHSIRRVLSEFENDYTPKMQFSSSTDLANSLRQEFNEVKSPNLSDPTPTLCTYCSHIDWPALIILSFKHQTWIKLVVYKDEVEEVYLIENGNLVFDATPDRELIICSHCNHENVVEYYWHNSEPTINHCTQCRSNLFAQEVAESDVAVTSHY